jgi:hypothetical protein
LSLNSPSGAESASDRATASKRIATFLQLCAAFIPCDHLAYDQAVFSLDAEVDADVDRAIAVLALVEDQHLPVINRLQEEAVSVLLQVLYFLHQGRVQFLGNDYRARLIEAHGQGILPKKAPKPGKNRPPRVVQDGHAPAPNPEQADDDSSEWHDVHVHDASHNRVQRLGKDGRPIMSHAGHEFVHNPEQAEVDMTKEDDAESTDTKDSGSSPRYTSGGEEDKANTPVPSSPQTKAARSPMGTSMPSETTKAAGFGSDTSPRKESGDNDELGRAGPN